MKKIIFVFVCIYQMVLFAAAPGNLNKKIAMFQERQLQLQKHRSKEKKTARKTVLQQRLKSKQEKWQKKKARGLVGLKEGSQERLEQVKLAMLYRKEEAYFAKLKFGALKAN